MITLDVGEARGLAWAALIRAGATEACADTVADHVVEAELAGHPSHGLRLIPAYCQSAGSPGFDLATEPSVAARRGAATTVDARGGLGYRAVALAVDCAVDRARDFGVGTSAVVRCGHAGRAGAWVERGIRRGCATIVMLGGSDPPFAMSSGPGGRPALHTNPVAIGITASGPPVVLDIATSMVAEGKVHVALARGTTLPEGSILTPEGVPSSDPREFQRGGSLLPFARHKGFGLSAMVEALAVALTGAGRPESEPREGALVICIAADTFQPAEDVIASVDEMRDRIRAAVPGGAGIAPGDPEHEHRSGSAGVIGVDQPLAETLKALAA